VPIRLERVTSDDEGDRDPDRTQGSRSSVAPPAATGQEDSKRRRKRDGDLPLWQEVIILLGLALGLAILLKSLFVQAFYIPSDSMRDTLAVNDRILVQKVSYWFDGEPVRGDIVVFKDPGGWLGTQAAVEPNSVTRALEFFGLYPTGDHLVKRVIGVGGDHVVCCDKQGRVTVNGVPLDESDYLAPATRPGAGDGGKFDVTVPEGKLWVMGDNRAQSADSRVHIGEQGGGFIPVEDVVGKVFLTVWPLDRASFTDDPEAFDQIPGTSGEGGNGNARHGTDQDEKGRGEGGSQGAQ
jgi:signal peptidase I